jgi:serine/threonine-protein kinase
VPEPNADDRDIMRDAIPRLLLAERKAGLLGPGEFENKRQAWFAAWDERRPQSNYLPFLWLNGYASVTETADDAARALAVHPRFGTVPRFSQWAPADAYIGATYVLAGRVPEALPFLRRATRSCTAIESPFEHTRAHLFLGHALAAAGERDQACAAYGVVLHRWGKARPRSITADEARSSARKLGCPERP